MVVPRFRHSAALLQDGQVLLTGGLTAAKHEPTASATYFDSATGAFAEVEPIGRALGPDDHDGCRDGRILVTGGSTSQRALSSAELYMPAT